MFSPTEAPKQFIHALRATNASKTTRVLFPILIERIRWSEKSWLKVL